MLYEKLILNKTKQLITLVHLKKSVSFWSISPGHKPALALVDVCCDILLEKIVFFLS